MRLRQVQVQNYRSIVDSGAVEIEDRVTVLIGKNEQGKTTFLKALASASPRVTYTPGDLPSHLQPELEKKDAAEIPIVTLWITPEETDVATLGKLVPDLDTVAEFKVIKYYDNHRSYLAVRTDGSEKPLEFPPPDVGATVQKMREQVEALREKLTAHAARLPAFAPHQSQATSIIDQFLTSNFDAIDQIGNLVQALTTGLTSVPGQDQAIQNDVAVTAKALLASQTQINAAARVDARAQFEQQLPEFVYHSTALDRIPNEVTISEFVANPNTVSRGMANLCAVAGLSMQKIQELSASRDTYTVETFEDHYKASVSGAINEFWTQEQYTVNFRFGGDKMSVSISDKTYQRRIPPLERSEGFQWYLSFYATLQSEVSAAGSAVFLIDNPGLELHADGQRDIKRFLEEKLMRNAQIVYVTHSPAMIDPFRLEQVRKVELQPEMAGTRVARVEMKKGKEFDLFDPIRTAIGASLATSLILDEFNVLVEGAADKPLLDGAFKVFQKESGRQILVNGSISESEDDFLVRFYQRANLPFVVFVDADSGGRDIAAGLKNVVPQGSIVNLQSAFPDKNGDFEIEDVLSGDFYHAAVTAEYPTLKFDRPPDAEGKRTKRYEKMFKEKLSIGFSKRRVADRAKALLLDGRADKETATNLTKLTSGILKALERQVRVQEGAATAEHDEGGADGRLESARVERLGAKAAKKEPPPPAKASGIEPTQGGTKSPAQGGQKSPPLYRVE